MMGAEGENIDHTMQSREKDATTGNAINNAQSNHESSSSDSLGVEHEKAMAGQAAMPIQTANPGVGLNPLTKLDSKVVVDVKAEEEDPFAHLPAHEADILRLQINVPPVTTGYFALYRYATRNDWIIFAISCLCTIAAGAAMPLMTVCIL
jgi:ATP-binding cassette subfamily B (MDR/TAP) protein 1